MCGLSRALEMSQGEVVDGEMRGGIYDNHQPYGHERRNFFFVSAIRAAFGPCSPRTWRRKVLACKRYMFCKPESVDQRMSADNDERRCGRRPKDDEEWDKVNAGMDDNHTPRFHFVIRHPRRLKGKISPQMTQQLQKYHFEPPFLGY